jgi:hypothetical protein
MGISDTLWLRIRACEGQEFATISGKPFTYEVAGNILITSRTSFNLAKSDFEKALSLVPIGGPGEISNLVRGSAYVWALLHDKRIRKLDW